MLDGFFSYAILYTLLNMLPDAEPRFWEARVIILFEKLYSYCLILFKIVTPQ